MIRKKRNLNQLCGASIGTLGLLLSFSASAQEAETNAAENISVQFGIDLSDTNVSYNIGNEMTLARDHSVIKVDEMGTDLTPRSGRGYTNSFTDSFTGISREEAYSNRSDALLGVLSPIKPSSNVTATQVANVESDIFAALGVSDWGAQSKTNRSLPAAQNLVYAPTRKVGALGRVQMGVSYAPEVTDCHDIECAMVLPNVLIGDQSLPLALKDSVSTWENVLETSVAIQKDVPLGTKDVTFGVGASYLSAEEDPLGNNTDLEGIKSYAVDLNLAYGGLTFEGSVKNTQSGFENLATDESYLAYDAGISYETGAWGFLLGMGANADQSLLGAAEYNDLGQLYLDESHSAKAGISYMLGHGITIGATAEIMEWEKEGEITDKETSILIGSSYKF